MVFYQSGIPQKAIKDIVEYEFSKTFQWEVTIERLSGNLLTGFTAHNLTFKNHQKFKKNTVIEIPRAHINYSLITAVRKLGDFAAATTKIRLENPRLNILRDSRDLWNVLHLIPPPPDPNLSPAGPPTFRGLIEIEDMSVWYTDEVGWAKQRLLETPFKDNMLFEYGTIDFKKISHVQIKLDGNLISSGRKIVIDGDMNAINGQYTFRFIMNPHLNQWGEYLFPLDGFTLSEDIVSIHGEIKSKNPFPGPKEMPFWYTIEIDTESAVFGLPFFPVSAEKVNASIQMAKHSDGQPAILVIHRLSANIADIAIEGEAFFDLENQNMVMNLQSRTSFDVASLKRLFPGIDVWKVNGDSMSYLTAKGRTQRPKVTGMLTVSDGAVYGFRPSDMSIAFTYQDKHLDYDVVEGSLYNGQLKGSGWVDFKHQPARIAASITGTGLSTTHAFPNSGKIITGNTTVHADINGDTLVYDTVLRFEPTDLQFIGQDVNGLLAEVVVLNNRDIVIDDFQLMMNDGDQNILAEGMIWGLTTANIQFDGLNIPVKNIESDHIDKIRQNGNMTLEGVLESELTPQFWKRPLDYTRATLNAIIQNYQVNDFFFDTIRVSSHYDRGEVSLTPLDARGRDQSIRVNGYFFHRTPKQLHVQTTTLDISTIRLLQEMIPIHFKPFEGRLSSDIMLTYLEDKTPSFPYQMNGSMTLEKGVIQGQPFDKITSDINWDGQSLSFKNTQLMHDVSTVHLSGDIVNRSSMDILIKKPSRIDFRNFRVLTAPLGNIQGLVSIDGRVWGDSKTPNVDVHLNSTKMKSNFLSFSKISGRVSYVDSLLKMDTLMFEQEDSAYTFDGYVDIRPFLDKKESWLSMMNYDLNVQLKNAEINNMTKIMDGIRQEIILRNENEESFWDVVKVAPKSQPMSFSIKNPLFSQSNVLLYSNQVINQTAAEFYQNIKEQTEQRSRQAAIESSDRPISGVLNGFISANSSRSTQAMMDAELALSDFKTGWLRTKHADLVVRSQDTVMTYDMVMNNGRLGVSNFTRLRSSGLYSPDGYLGISNVLIDTKETKTANVVSGNIPIRAFWDDSFRHQPMNLHVLLQGDTINLLALLNRNIGNISNKGRIHLAISGPLDRPKINSQLMEFDHAQLSIDMDDLFSTPFILNSKDISIVDNVIIIPPSKIRWPQVEKQERDNQLVVSGTVAINDLNMLNPRLMTLDLQLAAEDSTMTLVLPSVYYGKVALSDLRIKGEYLIPLSSKEKQRIKETLRTIDEKGPIISGDIHLYEGQIILPSVKKRQDKASWAFDLRTSFGNDVTLTGGLLGQGFLAGLANAVDVEFEDNNDPLLITGTLNAPKITNSIILSDGDLTFFNRNFELLDEEQQKLYFQNEHYKIQTNRLSFSSIEDTEKRIRLIPNLSLVAATVIEPISSVTSTENILDTPKYTAALLLIDGSVYDLNMMVFEEYSVDDLDPTSGTAIEFVNTYRLGGGILDQETDQNNLQIFKLLVPELVDESFTDTNNSNRTQELINIIGETQINTLLRRRVLRPVEKEIARNIGLYDLRVDYNVGRAILRDPNSQNETTAASDEQVGIDFMQRLFSDKLFLRVKTNLDLRGENSQDLDTVSISEIELRYYLTQNLSMIFENTTENDEQRSRPRFSIRYSYDY